MSKRINQLLLELENYFPLSDQQNTAVSKASIGWHIEHALLTLDRVIDRLAQSKNLPYKSKLSFGKLFVFTTRIIPKGRAESPESVRPTGDINTDTLKLHLALTKEKAKTLSQMKRDQYFEHPYFGHLAVKQAIRFLEIHTHHHLKIIRDIQHTG